MKSRGLVVCLSLIGLCLVCLGSFLFGREVKAEQQQERRQEQRRDILYEIVFRDAMARFSRLVPPKPGELYVVYRTDGDPVSANLVHRLSDFVPRVVTDGDPEFRNGPKYHSFMAGDIDDDGPGRVSIWVNTINRGNVTKADGLIQYSLSRSGGRWNITGRKFEKE